MCVHGVKVQDILSDGYCVEYHGWRERYYGTLSWMSASSMPNSLHRSPKGITLEHEGRSASADMTFMTDCKCRN
jgi:hypothetical protein